MKKFFRHITKVIIFSFVICLFLPLQAHAEISLPPRAYFCGFELKPPLASNKNATSPAKYGLSWIMGDADTRIFTVGSKRVNSNDPSNNSFSVSVAFVNSSHYVSSDTVVEAGSFYYDTSKNDYVEDSTVCSLSNYRLNNGDYCTMGGIILYGRSWSNFIPFGLDLRDYGQYGYNDEAFLADLNSGNISEYVDTNTDGYSLDKSLGMVKNAHWRHLESKDEYNKVLQDAINSGTGTGDSGNANYSDIYIRYASFVQDKCSFATTSTTGVKIGGRYQLQYASRVGFTFAYNLPDLLEGIDNTKQYYKKFGSPKPYPVVNGTNFDANKNIQSLFTQAYAWNDSLPSIGTWKRSLVFKETKYWIDVRIIDTKNKTYGAWYAMDMETNKASEVTTHNGDIDGDITSDDPADPYAKIEGEGDTFKDAEDNSHEVDHTQTYDQTWYDHIKDNTKKSAPAFKNLLSMITGIPKMIATLFSWLPNWVLELVSAFFALVVVLALLRFVLGS